MAASITHKAKTGALLTGTEYEAADAHTVSGLAPTDADYLVGTANAGLSAEIVVGTSPGGELGGTWASPTVDASHSGSTHAATQAAAEATASSTLTTHAAAADPHAGYVLESLLDAKGDLIAASADNTPAKVTVGADDTILMADSAAAAGVKWVASASPSAVGTAAATGTADTFTRGDHVHAHETAHVAHDTIFDAKGDLVAGTAADTASKLTVGADDTILMADAAQSTGLKWVASATPSTQAFGDAAAVGTADTFTRGDHKHAMPSLGTGSTNAAAGTVMVLVLKASDETVNNSAVLQNDDELKYAIAASEKWHFDCDIYYTTGGAVDLKATWVGPSGSTVRWSQLGQDAANGQLPGTTVLAGAATGTFAGVTATMTHQRHIGVISNGATPGDLQLQWAQNTQAGSDSVVHALSSLRLSKLG